METNFPLPTAEEVKEFCLSCGGGYGEVNAETDEFFVGGSCDAVLARCSRAVCDADVAGAAPRSDRAALHQDGTALYQPIRCPVLTYRTWTVSLGSAEWY